MSSALTDESGPPSGCCDLHTSFCKAQSLFKSLYFRPLHVYATSGLITCTAFSSHFKQWVYKIWRNCPILSGCCSLGVPRGPIPCGDPGSSAEGREHTRVLGLFTVFICSAQLKTPPGWKAGGYLCSRMRQNHLMEGEKAVPWFSFALSVFRLQIWQECVTVLVRPPWVTPACANPVQDKP